MPDLFELKYYHIIFIIVTLTVAFLFNIIIGGFYLMFIVLGSVGAFLKLNIYNAIPQSLYFYARGVRKDLNTIKYHWGTHFFFFKVVTRLTVISLPLALLVIAFALPFHPENDPVLIFNFGEIAIICCITFIGSFQVDLYIILFGNSSVFNKFTLFCYKCAVYGTFGVGTGCVLERQFIHNSFERLGFAWQPTIFTNGPNYVAGKPCYLDADQYWQHQLIQKYLPHITQEQYITKEKNILSQIRIDSTKSTQIIKANWQTLCENATNAELRRLNLKDQGYFSGGIGGR